MPPPLLSLLLSGEIDLMSSSTDLFFLDRLTGSSYLLETFFFVVLDFFTGAFQK